MATYSLFFSIYLTEKYLDYRTGYFDFGAAVQTAWLVSQGHFNALAMGRPISIIAGGLYTLYPKPETLLAFQSYVIALGALPVYFFAKDQLKNEWHAFGFSIVYLIYPLLWGVNQYEYHDLSFCITFLLFSSYFLSSGRLVPYAFSLALGLISSPFVVIIAVFIAASILLDHYRAPDSQRLAPFLFATVWITLGFVIYLQAIPFLPYFRVSSLSTESYTFTGSIAYINPRVLVDLPWYSITYAWQQKVLYLTALFGSVSFLPFLAPRRLLPGLPWLGVVIAYTPQLGAGGVGPVYEFSQWSSFLIAFVFIGAIMGLKRLPIASISRAKWAPTRKVGLLLVTLFTITLGLVAGGFSPISQPQLLSVGDSTIPTDVSPGSLYHGVLPTPVIDYKVLNWFIAQIPANYSVLTQNQIASKLGERLSNVWTFYQPSYGSVPADAILIDTNLEGLCSVCISQELSTGNYFLFLSYNDGGIYLYFRTG